MQTRRLSLTTWAFRDTPSLSCGQDIGVEFRQTGDELFLKQLYITPTHQRKGIGSQIIRLLNNTWPSTAKSMAVVRAQE